MRITIIPAVIAGTVGLSACTPITPLHFGPTPSTCATRDLGDRIQYDYTAERDYLGHWATKDGIILGFSAQEDGLVYYIRWCAINAPQY